MEEFDNADYNLPNSHFEPLELVTELPENVVSFSLSPPESNLGTPVRESNVKSVRKSNRLLNSKETPLIPSPNIFLETSPENVIISIQEKRKKSKVEHMKFNWVRGNQMDFEVDIPDYNCFPTKLCIDYI